MKMISKKAAFQIIANNFSLLEDGSRSIKFYAPFINDDLETDEYWVEVVKYYKDKLAHSKKVLGIVRKYIPKDHSAINQTLGRIDYCKTQINIAKTYCC